MAKKTNKPTKEVLETKNSDDALEIEKSDVVLEVVKKPKKLSKEEKAKIKASKKKAKAAEKKKKEEKKTKKSFLKGTFSELKKVSWPSFKQACKQTGAVLVVVAVFMIVILGIEVFLSWLTSLIA